MFQNFKEKELDKYIYRIISVERLIELFATNKNILVKPRKWDDPYENFILSSKIKLTSGKTVEYNYHDRIYGQCWTLNRTSDAMWRIYSPNGNGVRIRTTIRKLLESIYSVQPHLPEVKCCLGKLEYLSEKNLYDVANTIFDDSGVEVDNLFYSLLVKRKAFKHEDEVRLLYFEMDDGKYSDALFKYVFKPNSLIDQIMLDPRFSYKEFMKIKSKIKTKTGFSGIIKRSLLYSLPKDIVINATES